MLRTLKLQLMIFVGESNNSAEHIRSNKLHVIMIYNYYSVRYDTLLAFLYGCTLASI